MRISLYEMAQIQAVLSHGPFMETEEEGEGLRLLASVVEKCVVQLVFI